MFLNNVAQTKGVKVKLSFREVVRFRWMQPQTFRRIGLTSDSEYLKQPVGPTGQSTQSKLQANCQEDEAKALGQMDEEVEDSEPDQEDAKGSDESSDDGWGVGNKDVKAQLKPKRARQEKLSKEEKQGEGRPSTPAPAPQVPAPQSSAAQSGKVPSTVPKNVDKLVAQATTLVATLQQINPVLVWQNASKLKECEAKMAKSEPFVAALQEAEKTPAVLKVYNDLRVVWNDLGTFTDLIVSTKSSSVETVADANNFMNYIAEYGKDIVKFLGKQTPEFLKIVLCEFGRLFCEVGFWLTWRMSECCFIEKVL